MHRVFALTLLCLAVAGGARASTSEAWEAFARQVEESCRALIRGPGDVAIEVNPTGTEHFGVALVTVTLDGAAEAMVCVTDKATGKAELSGPFAVDLK